MRPANLRLRPRPEPRALLWRGVVGGEHVVIVGTPDDLAATVAWLGAPAPPRSDAGEHESTDPAE